MLSCFILIIYIHIVISHSADPLFTTGNPFPLLNAPAKIMITNIESGSIIEKDLLKTPNNDHKHRERQHHRKGSPEDPCKIIIPNIESGSMIGKDLLNTPPRTMITNIESGSIIGKDLLNTPTKIMITNIRKGAENQDNLFDSQSFII